MKTTRQRVLLFVLAVLTVVFVYHARVAWMPRPGRVPRVYIDAEVAAAWKAALAPGEAVDIRISPSDDLLVLADINDDGVIDDSDRALRADGLGELIRLDDVVCNGREVMGDRSPRWGRRSTVADDPTPSDRSPGRDAACRNVSITGRDVGVLCVRSAG